MAPNATVPSAPVYAARLSGLLKTLAQAEGAVDRADEAEVAMNACMKLERIELEGANDAYTPEMEHVSAEVYFQLLKRHGDSGNSPLKRRRIGGRGWNDELWGYDI